MASMFLFGTEMDYVEEKLQSGFTFRNPNDDKRPLRAAANRSTSDLTARGLRCRCPHAARGVLPMIA